jgi:cell division protease FtsH
MLLSHLELKKNLITSMGGAAAEDYVFGMLSTGVESDLDEATKMAHAMVAFYGMSSIIGPVTIGEKPGEVFIGRDLGHMGNVAAKTLEIVDEEIRRFVREAEETARRVVAMNAPLLEELANTLLEEETLTGPELELMLERVIPWEEPLLEHTNGRAPVTMRQPARAATESRDDVGGWPRP